MSPDLDAALMPVGWDLYLRVHQMGTHAIVGTVGCAALVAIVVWAFARGDWRSLALAAWIGAASHVVLDVASGATVRLLWPFSDAATRGGLVAMAEPLLVVIIVVAGLVFWRWPARRVNAATTCFALVLVVLAGKGMVRAEAQRLYASATQGEVVRAQVLEAEWGTISRWIAFDRTDDRVRRWRIDTSHSSISRDLDLPLATESGPQAVSLTARVVQNFLAAHEYPIAVATGSVAAAEILWSDLQYCWATGAPGALRPAVGSPTRPADIPIACGLWFGVAFDANGEIARQFVTIGEWTQER